MGLPAEITQKAYLTNATTTEFLKQFWTAFLSGDPDRAQELADQLQERLGNSVSCQISEVGAVIGAHIGPGAVGVVVLPGGWESVR